MVLDSIMRDVDNKNRRQGNNLSLLEFRILQYINNHKRVTPSHLTRKFNLTPPTITVQINRLVKKEHIVKTANSRDGRSVILSLSKQTKLNLEELLEKRLKLYDTVFMTLTKADQELFLQIMERLEIA